MWREVPSPEHLGEVRLAATDRFLADLSSWLACGVDAFDLALCSHFLFLCSDQLSADFRVAGEARVFSLLGAYGQPFPHLVPAIRRLRELGYGVQRRRVPHEFLRVTGP